MTAVRALAFGDREGSCWGAAWVPEGASPILALAAGSAAEARSATLAAQPETDDWRLETEDAELFVSPLPEPAVSADPDSRGSSDRLCRVTGRLSSEHQELTVDCLGWRADSSLPLGDDQLGSLRQVCAWFEPDEGVALLALRPDKAQGQEGDLIRAVLLEPESGGEVIDPRLSTTYAEDGRPTRAGIELWIGAESPSDETDEDEEHQYPRRLAGEAVGARVDWVVGGLALHAALFRWHSRDRDGAGLYLLGVRQ